uniref:peptidylprolyl isomerase n=1 Tax=Pseudonocardia pini TaxID=2758030 RepID=UPI0015F0901A
SRRGRLVLAVVLGVILVAGGAATWWATSRLPDGVAYRVDGVDVTGADVDREVETLGVLYGLRAPEDPAARDAFRRDAAKTSALGRVLDRAAADRDIVIAERSSRDVLDRNIEQYFGRGEAARAAFAASLAAAGTTEEDVLGEIGRQAALTRLFDDVVRDVQPPSDAAVAEAFEERRDSLATPERRALSTIVVADRPAADAVVSELRAGRPFADVARERSADGATRDAGGALGTLAAVQLERSFADAAFAVPLGEVFGPVQTRFGWNVGIVTGIEPARPAVLDRIEEPFRAQLQAEEKGRRWQDFLVDRLAAADVRYSAEYEPAEPDTLPEMPVGATPATAGPTR